MSVSNNSHTYKCVPIINPELKQEISPYDEVRRSKRRRFDDGDSDGYATSRRVGGSRKKKTKQKKKCYQK